MGRVFVGPGPASVSNADAVSVGGWQLKYDKKAVELFICEFDGENFRLFLTVSDLKKHKKIYFNRLEN